MSIDLQNYLTCKCCRQLCPRDTLQIHHKRARVNGGDDAPANLMTVCGRCHDVLHASEKAGNDHRLLVRKGLQNARANGVRLGPPRKLTPELQEDAKQFRALGYGYKEIAKIMGLSVGSIHKLVNGPALG